ncbi:MAG: HlyD family efflux transporter periplasmic adaptor subunit [Ignavibacteriales bacterium]|nr:HlyD family efflux transporter periplasmic adaptor subunit [Ignavibacteriales bacterium]
MKRRIIIISAVVILLLVAVFWFISGKESGGKQDVTTSPRRGEFRVLVTTTGELQAKNSIQVMGPENARAVYIWQMKISTLVPEGTVVKKGDFVADLDKSEITDKYKESLLTVQKLDAQYLQTTLDSTLTLAQARDELVNLRYAREEKQIYLEQSKYEAPAMQRQAEIDYERAQRNFTQAEKNYVTKKQQAIAKIVTVEADLKKERQRSELFQRTVGDFTVKAPADGMVIYAREWNGKKKVVGSTINAWEPTVATLPDLRDMESITYVSEIDIQKIAVGQSIRIKLDADPKKVLTGSIISVANIGEQRPNSDSKVFEVHIHVQESDSTLRPSMTTSNEILVAEQKNALSIPLECLHADSGRTFVYKQDRGAPMKQPIKLGLMNDNEAIVLEGLTEKDRIYLTTPFEAKK